MPSVKMLMGKVTIFNTSPSVAFSRPMTSAATSAGCKPSTWKPGRKWEITNNAAALSSQ